MWGWFGGGAAAKKNAPKNAIIGLREQLDLLQKRERHLETQIAEQEAIARKNVSSNKNLARAALRRKKLHETTLSTVQSQITTLEQQVLNIESATLNSETLRVMKEAGQALKKIHNGMGVEDVENVMDQIRDGTAVATEVGDAIARLGQGINDIDEDEIADELDTLEQEVLDNKMLTAPTVPSSKVGTEGLKGRAPAHATQEEEDEEAELRKLQAEMMM